jgi:uncharacterized protein (TIGR03437 family)
MTRLLPLLLGLSHGLVHAQSYTFTQFDVPGATGTLATAINNSGQILGTFVDAKGAPHCFLRDAAGAVTPFDPPGANAACKGLNNLGQVVGYLRDSKGDHGFVRSASGEFQLFDIPPRGPGADVAAINDRGEIAGTYASPPYGGPAFLRTPAGELRDLTAFGIGQIDPAAINNRGDIAGWALQGSSNGTQHGFFRSAEGVYRQFDLPGTVSYTRIAALNNAGQFAGNIQGIGFVGNSDGALVYLPGYTVSGIDDAGHIVGRRVEQAAVHGFIGTPGPSSTAPEIRTALPGVLPASAFGGGFRNPAIAPGNWIEIYGSNLAPLTRQWTSSDFRNGVAPTSLDDVRVTIAGVPAFISYISPGQVNALVPSGVPAGAARVILTNGARAAAPYEVTVAASRPAILSMPPTLSPDTAYVAALFPDFATYALPPYPPYAALPARRPKPGDTLVLFGMGFGPVSPDVPVGRIATAPSSLLGRLAISFNRSAAPVSGTVTYAGLVPGTVGLYQFNVILPEIEILPGSTTDDFVNVNVVLDGQPVSVPPALQLSIEK